MNLRSLLIASLAANLILAVLVGGKLTGTVGLANASASTIQRKGTSAVQNGSNLSPTASGTLRLDNTLWSHFDSNDLMTLARRLREAGFPSRAIRRIIWDLNSARGEIARAAIQGKRPDTPYWRSTPYLPDDPAKRERIREINQQVNQVYMKLMTDPEGITDDDEFAASMRERFGNLDRPKLQQAAKITQDYWEMRDAIHVTARKANANGELTSAENERLAVLYAEEQRDLQQVMSPEEYAEYVHRSSPTAARLREHLEVFRPSEQEYKAIFALQHAVDARFNISLRNPEPSDKKAYRDAMSALDPQLEAALGKERYAEYLVATDQTNNKLKRIVVRLNLPLTTVSTLTALQSDISQRADALRKNASLSAPDRSAQLADLALEAHARLTATLGTRGYEAYEQAKGSWLRALTDRPPTSSQ